MESKKSQSFFRKNIYYFAVAFMLVAAAVITAILVANNSQEPIIDVGSGGGQSSVIAPPDSSSSGNVIENPDDSSGTPDNGNESSDTSGNGNNPDNTQISQQTTYILPVENARIIKDYSQTTLCYNSTLNCYTGHLAIDFAAEEGEEVKVCCTGTIESIETSYLTGTTVTVVHLNGIKTVYNSIEAAEDLKVGDKVTQGDVIGYVSDNNRQEYKDGPHLHFEVLKDNNKVSPYAYLNVEEK